MSELLKYAIIVLIPFMVQLAVLFFTANRLRPLRLAVPILIGVADIIAIVLNCRDVLEDWGSLRGTVLENLATLLGSFVILAVVIFCLFLVGLALMGWALAWAVYYLIKFIIS